MKTLSLLIKPASGNCNYNCAYCFYRDEVSRRKNQDMGIMDYTTLESLVRKAFAASEGEVLFMFQGGEPTLAGMDFFEKASAYQKKYSHGKPYANALQTNGSTIDEDWARFLKKENYLVGLSLDGDAALNDKYRIANDGSGTWAKTIRAAETLNKHGIPFNVLCVITKDSSINAEALYETLKPYRYLQFIPCLEAFGATENVYAPSCEEYAEFLIQTFDLYERDLLNNDYTSVRLFDNYIHMLSGRRPESCAMNGRCSVSLTIESDGNVYPCDFYCLDEWLLGNINDNTISELISAPKARDFVNSSVYVDRECRACKFFVLCRGGCRREREPFERATPKLNRYCNAYKSFFNERYERLINLKRLISANRVSDKL